LTSLFIELIDRDCGSVDMAKSQMNSGSVTDAQLLPLAQKPAHG